MKLSKLSFLLLTLLLPMGVLASIPYAITLENSTSLNRTNEAVFVDIPQDVAQQITNLKLVDDTEQSVPYQYLANESKIVFQATISSNSSKTYTLKAGTPATVSAKTYAAQKMPTTRNDIAWENDLAAYRMYSKVLLKSEPNTANGVDLWAKKKSEPIIDKMYTYSNYHAEQVEGVDAYSVNGKTLGAGGVAIYSKNKIWMHDPYDECEIIHNGPLYSEFVLKYHKVLIDGDYYEKTLRVSTVANGTLNKAVVRYEGRNKPMKIASGIFLHTNMGNVTPAGVQYTSENNVIAYAENKSEGTVTSANARFYEGVYMPGKTTTQTVEHQLLIMSDYAVGSDFTFYFGGGWNIFPEGRYTKDQDWFTAVKNFKLSVQNPLYQNIEQLPTKAEVINDAIRVNSHWQSTRAATAMSKEWFSGVYQTGNMLFYSFYPKKNFLDYSKQWATANTWSILTHPSADADSYIAGQTYIDLYNLDEVKDPNKIAAIKARVDSKLKDTKSDEWWWIDAMYMAMPVYARIGAMTGDNRYYEKMYSLFKNCRDILLVSPSTGLWTNSLRNQYGTGPIITGFEDAPHGLYNKEDGLWYRDWGFQPGVPDKWDPNNGNNTDNDPNSDYCPKQTPNGKQIYWGRGNGWVIGAMAHTLTHLPEDAPHRQEYIDILQSMANALKDRQRSDGFWNMSLDDDQHMPGGETSGTALITYALAWGINNDLLDYETYYPIVAKGWHALSKIAVETNGVLGYIQGIGEAPINPKYLSTTGGTDIRSGFGVGAYMCAATEVARLAPGDMPEIPVTPLGIDEVKLINSTTLQVSFSEDLDLSSALDIENYQIANAPAITKIESVNQKSINLTFANEIDYGVYSIKIVNVKAEEGAIIDTDNTRKFVRTVPLTPVNYDVEVTAIGNQAGNPPAHVIDNNLDTRWAQAGINQWILFDFGEERDVEAIDISYYLGNTRTNKFNVQFSYNGTTFRNVLSNKESSGLTDELERYYFPKTVTARYFRIMCNGNSTGGENWNSLTEVRFKFSIPSNVDHLIESNDKLSIFPNPYKNGELTIIGQNNTSKVWLTVNDLTGKQLINSQIELQNGKANLDLEHLIAGNYFIAIRDEFDNIQSQILIKK